MTKIQSGIKITAPATIGGLGVGLDILAFALDKSAVEIIIHKGATSGILIKTISGDKGKLSTVLSENLAGLAAQLVYEALLKEHDVDKSIGIEIDLRQKLAADKGLGEQEALAVVGAMAVNEFFGSLFSKKELLPFIDQACSTLLAEYSLAAIATSLMGGCMIVCDKSTLDVRRLPVPQGIFLVVAYPTLDIEPIYLSKLTSLSMPSEIGIEQSRLLAGFFWAMYRSDFELIGKSIQSPLFDAYFEEHFQYLKETKKAALDAGALATGLCHTGPAVFAFCTNTIAAEKCSSSIQTSFKRYNLRSQVFTSMINNEGSYLE
jgi:homoserine kinase